MAITYKLYNFSNREGIMTSSQQIGSQQVSDTWRRRDSAVVWHPFTQHASWVDDEPLVVDRANGPWLFDVDGRRYLDGVSSLWVTTFGHGVPEIDTAICEQLAKLDHSTFLGATHAPGIELAEHLLSVAPKGSAQPELAKVFYAGDGSSAVEAALKLAYQYGAQRGTDRDGPDASGGTSSTATHDRPLFVHLSQAYHGDTLGAVSVGGIELFHATYRPILLRALATGSPGVRAPGQSAQARAAEAIRELSAVMAKHGGRVCAIIVEPMVQGAAGMLTYDPAYLRACRQLATQYGALLICDEVATGIGRTGRMWACEHAVIVPDLLVCGKGLTGGYLPLSAVLATQEVYEAFLGAPATNRTFFHGHTYTANPLACAAALANLRLMGSTDLVGRAAKLGERLGELLAPLHDHPGVLELRRLGTMIGIQLRAVMKNGVTARTGSAVCKAARDHGVLLRPLGDTVIVMPPLALEAAEAQLLANAVIAAVDEVTARSGGTVFDSPVFGGSASDSTTSDSTASDNTVSDGSA
ncbi:MAG: adenosylmethionine--8-amino-7-oxononanoate transaminase [Mycobacteriales bacterium]